jgi:hypothetical protein
VSEVGSQKLRKPCHVVTGSEEAAREVNDAGTFAALARGASLKSCEDAAFHRCAGHVGFSFVGLPA